MKNSTKGAVAAAAAGVLLLGGAGSLAFWSATDTVSGTDVVSGELKLSSPSCTGWKFDGSETTADKAYVPDSDKIVPGDVLTQKCDYTITAIGEHLRATLTAPNSSLTGSLATYITPSSTFKYKTPSVASGASAGDPVGSITESADGSVVTAELKVTFNPGSDNASQSAGASTLTAALGDFVVTFTQAHS
ncbi:alternate-type signal peptide domain-containing protein [Aeromicrobium sp.]|uniref:alternate-type signal peptide domain-containing protein n=1 Tax=Aeromicrobium sp. TaxID=1871063 RepID=UPI003C5BDD46